MWLSPKLKLKLFLSCYTLKWKLKQEEEEQQKGGRCRRAAIKQPLLQRDGHERQRVEPVVCWTNEICKLKLSGHFAM